MNYKNTFGWYYNSPSNRAPAWTGVEFFYNFLIKNNEVGPYASEIEMEQIIPGDVIQLSFSGIKFEHSLLVVQTGDYPALDNILIATHTDNSDNRPLSSYHVTKYRFLKINSR